MNEIREDCEHKKAERKYWKYSQRISIVATSAACIAAVFTYGAYREAARQAIVAQRALDSSTRPWLFIEKIYLKDPLVIEDGKIKLSVKAVLKNYSQSPALGGELLAQIVQLKPGISYPRNETKYYCSKFNSRFIFDSSVISNELKETTTSSLTTTINQSDLFFMDVSKKKYARLSLISCINYLGLDGKAHQTAAHAQLLNNISSVFFDPQKAIFRPEDLIFQIDYMTPNEFD